MCNPNWLFNNFLFLLDRDKTNKVCHSASLEWTTDMFNNLPKSSQFGREKEEEGVWMWSQPLRMYSKKLQIVLSHKETSVQAAYCWERQSTKWSSCNCEKRNITSKCLYIF